MVQGFKCFKKGLINRYGMIFELGKVYHDDKEIKFHQSGFHMCTNLEDTLRYFDAFNEEVDIASVIGSGKINKYDDEYNGFYDMYSVEYLQVCHVLTRDEIMSYVLDLPPMRVKRFISLYKLSKEELLIFYDKYYNNIPITNALNYYQNEKEKVYIKKK